MLRFFVPAGLLASLAGCAGPAANPLPSPVAPVVSAARSDRGTILAVRAVPLQDPQPLRALLQRLGGGAPVSGTNEFIVRDDAGDVLAVVQPADAALLPGVRVAILPGAPALIRPLSARLAAR